MADLDALVERVNKRLKRIKLYVRGDRLSFRGTLPPKPSSGKSKPHQQWIALNSIASPESIKKAESLALRIESDLNLGEFDWRKFSHYDDPDVETLRHCIEKFTEQFWEDRDPDNPAHHETWSNYQWQISRLEPFLDDEPSPELLRKWAESASKYGRRYARFIGQEILQIAGLDTELIKKVRSPSRKNNEVDPRLLPTNAEIQDVIDAIKNPGWKHLFGLQATYGLRNHEVFLVDYSRFPRIVIAGGKTGSRAVTPLIPEWCDRWSLDTPSHPINLVFRDGQSDRIKGKKLSAYACRCLPWNPYTLRHCYARTCAEIGIDLNISARLMGHSIDIHRQTYQQFIPESLWLDIAEGVVKNKNRTQ